MENPFEIILARLDQIELQVKDIKETVNKLGKSQTLPDSEFMHLKDIIPKYFSTPTFYKLVHQKRIVLYKIGWRSFVKRAEFFQAFRKVGLA